MTYEEALEYALHMEWKVKPCNSGEICWCRVIEPLHTLVDDDENEIYIATAGSISAIHAEYIVSLHNKSLKEYDG
jgi:hypothetical protein